MDHHVQLAVSLPHATSNGAANSNFKSHTRMRIRSAFVPHDLTQPLRGRSSGTLSGLRVAVKDMYDIAGQRTGGGNPDWLSHQAPAQNNAAVVQTLLDAGAEIIGKTICDEFFFSIAGANAHYGTPVNPRAPLRLPGGSSSGSASATAAGACDLGIGSDTGGSVRVPASFCGIYGIRPTLGRIATYGMMPMSHSFDTPGWLAASPGVFSKGRILLDGNGAPGRVERLLVAEDAFDQSDRDVASFLRSALTNMAADLPPLAEVQVAPGGFDVWRETFRTVQSYEVWQTFGRFVLERNPRVGPGIRERLDYASQISSDNYAAAVAARSEASKAIAELIPHGSLLVLPTTPCIAPSIDISGEAADAFRTRVMRLTCIAGIGGLPQVSLPIGAISGFPIGLSFIGWQGADEVLLDFSVALSRYCGMVD